VCIAILFGGLNRERLVSVATAQALHAALPDADLWFWDVEGDVYEASSAALADHSHAFEVPFNADGPRLGNIAETLDRAKAEDRLLLLGLHGGMAENGELQLMCELRGVPFTGSGSLSSHLAFDKAAAKRYAAIAGLTTVSSIPLQDMPAALAEHGKLIAKPMRDGSSYGLIIINSTQDFAAVYSAAENEEYLIEPFIAGVEATCSVLEDVNGSVMPLPTIEIIPANGAFDYAAKYLAKTTQEICPGRFATETNRQIMDHAVRAHQALSCRGYSRSDFIVTTLGPIYVETNTLPGLTKASLYPKALKAHGIEFVDFLKGQIAIARKQAQR
jgi:D-alanine-D-alanine ligase